MAPAAKSGSRSTRPDASSRAAEWAAKRQAKIEAAKAKREKEKDGEVTDQHTFRPEVRKGRASQLPQVPEAAAALARVSRRSNASSSASISSGVDTAGLKKAANHNCSATCAYTATEADWLTSNLQCNDGSTDMPEFSTDETLHDSPQMHLAGCSHLVQASDQVEDLYSTQSLLSASCVDAHTTDVLLQSSTRLSVFDVNVDCSPGEAGELSANLHSSNPLSLNAVANEFARGPCKLQRRRADFSWWDIAVDASDVLFSSSSAADAERNAERHVERDTEGDSDRDDEGTAARFPDSHFSTNGIALEPIAKMVAQSELTDSIRPQYSPDFGTSESAASAKKEASQILAPFHKAVHQLLAGLPHHRENAPEYDKDKNYDVDCLAKMQQTAIQVSDGTVMVPWREAPLRREELGQAPSVLKDSLCTGADAGNLQLHQQALQPSEKLADFQAVGESGLPIHCMNNNLAVSDCQQTLDPEPDAEPERVEPEDINTLGAGMQEEDCLETMEHLADKISNSSLPEPEEDLTVDEFLSKLEDLSSLLQAATSEDPQLNPHFHGKLESLQLRCGSLEQELQKALFNEQQLRRELIETSFGVEQGTVSSQDDITDMLMCGAGQKDAETICTSDDLLNSLGHRHRAKSLKSPKALRGFSMSSPRLPPVVEEPSPPQSPEKQKPDIDLLRSHSESELMRLQTMCDQLQTQGNKLAETECSQLNKIVARLAGLMDRNPARSTSPSRASSPSPVDNLGEQETYQPPDVASPVSQDVPSIQSVPILK